MNESVFDWIERTIGKALKSFVYIKDSGTIEALCPYCSLASIEEAIEVVRAFSFEIPDKPGYYLWICHSNEKMNVVGLDYKANYFNGIEPLCPRESRTDENVDERKGDKGKSLLRSEGYEVNSPWDEQSLVTHEHFIGASSQELLV